MSDQWADVILFKPSGKYYTEESWRIPDGAIGPYDMADSPDFRRIGGGAVLVVTQEPWGYPHLFPADDARIKAEALREAADIVEQSDCLMGGRGCHRADATLLRVRAGAVTQSDATAGDNGYAQSPAREDR